MRIVSKAYSAIKTLVFLALLFWGCGPERVSKVWTEVPTGTSFDLHAIWFADDVRGFAVGGNSWFEGTFVYTSDGGASWQAEKLGDKVLFDATTSDDGMAYTTGIDGFVWQRGPTDTAWSIRQMYLWIIMRGIATYRDERFTVVGGQAYQHGVAISLDANFQEVSRDSFLFELSDVAYRDSACVFAVGYGGVIRSDDGGLTWRQLALDGEFFRNVTFVNQMTGFISGSEGTLLRTTDGGDTWVKVMDAGCRFLNMCFVDDKQGYLCGFDGVVMQTTDGGNTWQRIANAPNHDFTDITVRGNKVWVCAMGGKIFCFEQ